jgi:uncharacterized protein (DUF302 family)
MDEHQPAISTEPAGKGIAHLRSPYSAAETLTRTEAAISARGIPILARIDHAAAAAQAGLAMPAATVLIFGNATAGTPIMLAAPTTAIDLPLKILVWDDASGQTWLSYNTPQYLHERHDFPAALMANLAAVRLIAESAVQL